MILKDSEIRLADLMKRATELEPQVKEYYDAYMTLRIELDSAKERIEQEKGLIEYTSRIKNEIAKNRPFRVVRSESHTEMKPREKKKLRKEYVIRYKWSDMAVAILRKTQRMMSTDDIWDIIMEDHNKKGEPIENPSKVRWGAINNCWLKSKPFFTAHGLLGLKELQDQPGYIVKKAM